MLNLAPPYLQVCGVPVASDHADPRQFYYYPNRPHLAVDESGRPAVRLIVFRRDLDDLPAGEEQAVGILVFDTSLAWPDEVLKKVARKIKETLDLDELPRLAPIPVRSGTCKLMFLDRVTEPPPVEGTTPVAPAGGDETPSPPSEKWVTFLEGSGVPSLYGENRAIFSAMLNKEALAMVTGAFEGFTPAGVIYDLRYAGLQRAFNLKVEAQWEQIYHHFQESVSVNLIFLDFDSTDIIDDLIDKKLVKIEGTIEGVGEEGLADEFESVKRELQKFVIENFFKPAVNPHKVSASSTPDDVADTLNSVRNVIAVWPTAGYTRLDLDLTEVRSFNVDYTIAQAVERHILPQAHLSIFFEDAGVTRDQVVTLVDGSDALWQVVPFDVLVNADFAGDGLAAVTVDLAYGGELEMPPEDAPSTRSFLFDARVTRGTWSAWFDPAAGSRLWYRYRVAFAPGLVPGPDVALDSGWRRTSGHQLVITPSELYATRRVEIFAGTDFPFDRYGQVAVTLRATPPGAEPTEIVTRDFVLDAANRKATFTFRARRDAPPQVEQRLVCWRTGGDAVELDFAPVVGDLVPVRDPMPDRLEVRVLVAGDRTKIQTLIVDLKYEDLEHELRHHGTLVFDAATISAPQPPWSVPLADPSRRRYWYSQTLIDTDGNVHETGWIQSEARTLTVGFVYALRMEIEPSLVGPPLAEHELERVVLKLRYEDASGGVREETEQLFLAPGAGTLWRVELKDVSKREYAYDVVYVLKSGFERRTGWRASRDHYLVLSSVPPEV